MKLCLSLAIEPKRRQRYIPQRRVAVWKAIIHSYGRKTRNGRGHDARKFYRQLLQADSLATPQADAQMRTLMLSACLGQ